ncbi:MAG: Dps family protein [Candidatus Nitrosotenuis sp.]
MNGINIGIADKNRKAVTGLLSKLLADEYVLYTRTRNYHWNVVGPHFNDLHKFFESQYGEMDSYIDEIAERIRSLGEKTPATLAWFVKNARIKEHPELPSADRMVSNLVSDHESVIQALREAVFTCEQNNDVGTADFLTGLMEKHEKTAWMLRSVLEK